MNTIQKPMENPSPTSDPHFFRASQLKPLACSQTSRSSPSVIASVASVGTASTGPVFTRGTRHCTMCALLVLPSRHCSEPIVGRFLGSSPQQRSGRRHEKGPGADQGADFAMQELLKVKRNLAKRGGKEVDFEWNSRENAAFHGSNEVSQRAKSDSRQVFVAPRISGHPLQRTQPTTMPTSSDLKDIAYDQIES